MGNEIELKYLLRHDGIDYSTSILFETFTPYIAQIVYSQGTPIKQGYLPLNEGLSFAQRMNLQYDFSPSEARLRDKSGKYIFTLKGKGGLSRGETEVEIERTEFDKLWALTEGKRILKNRLKLPFAGHSVEFDLYRDRDLFIAEIELPNLESARNIPPIGKDVTEDQRFKNVNLAS